MKIKKLIKTPWSSVVGGGFQIQTDNGTYLASIIGTDKGIDKEIDAEICSQLMNCFNKSPTLEAIIAKIEAEKGHPRLTPDHEIDRAEFEARNAALDKAISIIREFQTNQTKGN